MKEYFRLITKECKEEKHTKILVYLGSKNKKHLRGSTQATMHPLATILTLALCALVRAQFQNIYMQRAHRLEPKF